MKGRQNVKTKEADHNIHKFMNFDALSLTNWLTLDKFLVYLSLCFLNIENEWRLLITNTVKIGLVNICKVPRMTPCV